MRDRCRQLGCKSYAIWTDVESGATFCGAHAVLVIDGDDADTKEKRAEFGREYARDAKREAVRS